jgi:hypothetical protein
MLTFLLTDSIGPHRCPVPHFLPWIWMNILRATCPYKPAGSSSYTGRNSCRLPEQWDRELGVSALPCCHYTHQQYSYQGPKCFLWFKIIFPKSCWFLGFWMQKAISPYSLHNLQIFFSGLFICAILYVSQDQVGLRLGNLEFYHVYRSQRAWMHPAEVCVHLFLSFFPLVFPIVILLP